MNSSFSSAIAWIVVPLDIGVDSGPFLFNSWRIYLALCTAPSLSSAVLFGFMPESPKFLLKVGTVCKNHVDFLGLLETLQTPKTS